MSLSTAAVPGQVPATSTLSPNDGEGGNGSPRELPRPPDVPADGPRDKQAPTPALSQMVMSGDGTLMVTLEDAVGRDLRGRKTVVCMVLNDEEAAEVRRRVADAQEGMASWVLGHLPKMKK